MRAKGCSVANYKRIVTGVSTVIYLVKQLCRIQVKFGSKIVSWASGALSPTDFSTFMAWYNQISLICQILEAAPDD